jgi:hypothetical protein
VHPFDKSSLVVCRRDALRVIAAVVFAAALAGCSIADKVSSRNEYERSASSYKQCLTANPSAPQQCEGLRLAMEAVERKRDSIDTDLQFKPGTPPPDYAQPR